MSRSGRNSLQTAQTSAWLDLIAAHRAQTADEAPPNNYSCFNGGVVFGKTRSFSGGQSILHTISSQPGKKNKWRVFGELEKGPLRGPGDNTRGLHLDATHHSRQHPQHLSWVQFMQGSQPPSHCPAPTCWGCVKSSEKMSCLTLPTFTRARESREGEGNKHLVSLLGEPGANHCRD